MSLADSQNPDPEIISPDLSDDDDTTQHRGSIPITFLAQMITSFNGNSSELSNFLQNAENALSIAKENQKTALTALIFSKVSSEVKNKINASEINTFTDLKIKLKQVFQITESLTYLQEQLETCRQKPNETVKEFFLRIEHLNSRIIQKIKESTISNSMLVGKLALINEMALRRFTHHCKPEISNILRHKTFMSINEALSIASEEESFVSMQNQLKISLQTNKKYCKICKRNNHNTNECRNKNFKHSGDPPQSKNYNNSFKKCDFCHFRGHTIDECRKKKRNENLNNPNPKVAHVNSQDSLNLNFEQLGLNEAPIQSTSKESASPSFQML